MVVWVWLKTDVQVGHRHFCNFDHVFVSCFARLLTWPDHNLEKENISWCRADKSTHASLTRTLGHAHAWPRPHIAPPTHSPARRLSLDAGLNPRAQA